MDKLQMLGWIFNSVHFSWDFVQYWPDLFASILLNADIYIFFITITSIYTGFEQNGMNSISQNEGSKIEDEFS